MYIVVCIPQLIRFRFFHHLTTYCFVFLGYPALDFLELNCPLSQLLESQINLFDVILDDLLRHLHIEVDLRVYKFLSVLCSNLDTLQIGLEAACTRLEMSEKSLTRKLLHVSLEVLRVLFADCRHALEVVYIDRETEEVPEYFF